MDSGFEENSEYKDVLALVGFVMLKIARTV